LKTKTEGQLEKEPIIKIDNIVKEYPAGDGEPVPVLRGVSTEIYPGDYAIIYGASGSGKSTLLHHIIGLEVPTSGKIIVCGTDITKLNSEDRAVFRAKHFGMVYQSWYWAKSLSVWENVAMPLFIAGTSESEAKKATMKILEETGMIKYADKRPMQLSGGEQQRVCLARALINDPRIVMADEPTGNLDTHNADQVMQTFQKLNTEGKRTIVMVTHNMAYLPYANKTISVEDGKIVPSKSTSSLQKEETKS
jgi:ABC-type lipoprotein export system ATPase subunit